MPEIKKMRADSTYLRIEWRALSSLKPNVRNPRSHSEKQIHQIAASIREFGFNNPILIDRHGQIVCGTGRFKAARLAGFEVIPTIRIDHLSEAQIRAYVIADNKVAINAGWDPEILALELQELSELDLPFDLEVTGFDTAEIDLLIDDPTKEQQDPLDDVPDKQDRAVSRIGDLWHLGPHKLICADALTPATYAAILVNERARVVFADPPYNVRISGHVSGLGSIRHREFAMASGEMESIDFIAFLSTIFRNISAVSIDGAIHFVCMDWRHISEIITAAKPVYSEMKNLCVWSKSNGGMGSFYRSQHELVFVFKVGTAPHVNTIELGRSGRYRTNVWTYPGVNTFRRGRLDELVMHPTVKPVALVVDAIKDCTRRGEIVLDPFAGSGTTIIAAEKSRRRARVVEIDALYADVSIRRWQKMTGNDAIHESSEKTFAQITEERLTTCASVSTPDNISEPRK